jgi:DNA mismatch repair protein MutH
MEPPRDQAELEARARALAGRTILEVARDLGVALPPDPRRAKGFVGNLVERALGGTSGSRPEPDFSALGIELKTLPVTEGRVRESTFVCTAPLRELGSGGAAEREWGSSRVRHKLARVLFVPIEADPRVAPAHRRVGAGFVWSPRPDEEAVLRADWEELTGTIGAGDVESLDATRGVYLQLRPKGANAAARVTAYDADGAPFRAPMRAFYLRARFTALLLERAGLT